jgi:phospholipid:diacylglycerol acyltransferase
MQIDGVQLSPDGDGTVPLLSLGALCAGGWRTKRLNPAGAEVVIREYPNNPVPVLRDARWVCFVQDGVACLCRV